MTNEEKLMNAIKATDLDPSVRLEMIRESGAVLYEVIGGSQSYGTNLPTSDIDRRGFFSLPIESYTSTTNPIDQVSDDREMEGNKKKNDDIFYTFRRAFELLKGANPNMIELLWTPPDCIISRSPEMDIVIANRDLFISKACLGSHFGYAQSQIGRAKGKNKKVNNPWPAERPKKLDYCRIIPCIPGDKLWTHPDVASSKMPFRPILMSEMPWIDLKDYHVAAVEHMRSSFRLYYYGEGAKGVFRGDDMLVCESIPIDDEWARFSGILLYDENEYDKAVKDWKSYWDWVRNRNILRWTDQENGKLQFDAKNMCHCVRLLMSGLNIIKNGEPTVRFSGKSLEYLMDIRLGKITDYDWIMKDVQERIVEMEEAAKSSSIPYSVDEDKIEALYSEVSNMAWERIFK